MDLKTTEATGLSVPSVWGGVPQKNKNFTGRELQLADLRRQLAAEGSEPTAVLPQALKGLGGVGKTQLAVEYAYRFQSHYELVWWVPSDQPALVRSTLASLAPQLGLSGNLRVEEAVSAVLEALRRGEPFHNWLLIFDNADEPSSLKGLLPQGTGHVLVTSRNPRWDSVVNTVEVDVFARAESLEFLRRRVPGIDEADADRLATELGDLPLALEQAGALQVEMGMAVREYLELLDEEGNKLLAEAVPSDYPKPVAAAWSLSMNRLKEHAPFALELLRRCAFFGPEPIALDLFYRGKDALGTSSEFGRMLRDRLQVGRALRELGRYSLARIDNINKTIQVHRLIQRLIAGELTEKEQDAARRDVHRMLVAADPDDAWDAATWPQFAALLPHIGPSHIMDATETDTRKLVWHVVEYLNFIGDSTTALARADLALDQWKKDSGELDPDVLILNGVKADALWGLGRYKEAFDLRRPTLDRITDVLGQDHEETLKIVNGHGADLRARGEFEAARRLDEDSLERHIEVYGDDNFRTHNAANNLAVDYGLTSAYKLALELDQKTLTDRRNLSPDAMHVVSQLGAVARDQRQAGQYLEARRTAEQAYLAFQDLIDRGKIFEDHAWILLQAKDLSVARRKAGAFPEALTLATDVYDRYRASRQFDVDHPDTLAAGINLGNAQRVAGDPEEAADRIERTVRRYHDTLGPDHPYTHGSALNLALVHRQLGRVEEARVLLVAALAGLEKTVGHDHHYTLTCLVNLATTNATLGDVEEALKMGESALPRFRSILGVDHPHTLVCATNVALDLAALDRQAESTELADDTMTRYRRVLGTDHPDVIAGMNGERLDFDFEPAPL